MPLEAPDTAHYHLRVSASRQNSMRMWICNLLRGPEASKAPVPKSLLFVDFAWVFAFLWQVVL